MNVPWSINPPWLGSSREAILARFELSIREIEAGLILPCDPLPWWVFGNDPSTGTVFVHFLEPLDKRVAGTVHAQLHVAADRYLPMTLQLSVTERKPACTVHPDCWEAGEEMRRACYAANRPIRSEGSK